MWISTAVCAGGATAAARTDGICSENDFTLSSRVRSDLASCDRKTETGEAAVISSRTHQYDAVAAPEPAAAAAPTTSDLSTGRGCAHWHTRGHFLFALSAAAVEVLR